MKIELFVLPEKAREQFIEAFVLTREEFRTVCPDMVSLSERTHQDFDVWYDSAYLWDKMSPDMPAVTFREALRLLRTRQGTVLMMSETELSGHQGGLIHHGRCVFDYVAMVDAQELADCIAKEWYECQRSAADDGCPSEAILPEDLYVFDTSLDWVIVFTHEINPLQDSTAKDAESRFCLAFGL